MNSSYWFELAVIFLLTSVGGIVFAPFAEGVPMGWRLAKVFVAGGLGVLVSAAAGRGWFFVLLAVVAVAVLVVHAWWLPRHGINGWTAEPRERYRALRGWKAK